MSDPEVDDEPGLDHDTELDSVLTSVHRKTPKKVQEREAKKNKDTSSSEESGLSDEEEDEDGKGRVD